MDGPLLAEEEGSFKPAHSGNTTRTTYDSSESSAATTCVNMNIPGTLVTAALILLPEAAPPPLQPSQRRLDHGINEGSLFGVNPSSRSLVKPKRNLMTTYQITCHRPDNADRDRRMQGVGGPDAGGWYGTVDAVISLINNGHSFWTVDQRGNSVWVIVAKRNGREYIKTQSDDLEPNNLLSLPVCPQ